MFSSLGSLFKLINILLVMFTPIVLIMIFRYIFITVESIRNKDIKDK